jgi:hypothetical protein
VTPQSPPHVTTDYLKSNLHLVKALTTFLIDRNILPPDAAELVEAELGAADFVTYRAVITSEDEELFSEVGEVSAPIRADKLSACRDAVALAMQEFLAHSEEHEYWFTTEGDENIRFFARVLSAEDPAEVPAETWEYRVAMLNSWMTLRELRIEKSRPKPYVADPDVLSRFTAFLESRSDFFPD